MEKKQQCTIADLFILKGCPSDDISRLALKFLVNWFYCKISEEKGLLSLRSFLGEHRTVDKTCDTDDLNSPPIGLTSSSFAKGQRLLN